MKIRLRDHVKVPADKMAKIGLAGTARAQLDLYCVAPGQSQSPHRHEDQDKIYSCSRAAGASRSATAEERLEAGDALVAPGRSRARPRQRRLRAPAGAGAGDAAAGPHKRGPAS